MKIEIIGSNTINGIKLRKKIVEIANNIEGKVVITLIEDFNNKDLPFLYINNQLVSKKIIPHKKEIINFIKKNAKDE